MIDSPRLPRPTYNFTEQLKLLFDGQFSDFEINCEGDAFKAHRAVICTQSSFFKALAGGDFKEATEQTTTIEDEESALLARYLIYLYSDSYPEGNVSLVQSGSQFETLYDPYCTHVVQQNSLKACELHAQMYCFARRRCDDRLERYALQEFSRNYWAKRPRQKPDKHNLEPKGPARTIKYHMGVYSAGSENTIIVGNKNTYAEVYDLLSDFADWSEITILPKRIRANNADPLAAPYRHRSRHTHWRDNATALGEFDFDNTHLIVTRSATSHTKNLSLLSCLDRWTTKTVSQPEQELIRLILSDTTEYGDILRDMISLDLIMRKHHANLIPDPTFRALQLDFPAFFLSLDSLVNPSERRQCTVCSSIQPALRQPCSCGKWSDACENDCLSKQVEKLKCFCCLEQGKMKILIERNGSGGHGRLSSTMHGLLYPYDYLLGDEFDF